MTNEARRTEEQDHGREQAEAQARSIKAMVAALGVDYDRLEELEEIQTELEELEELSKGAWSDVHWSEEHEPEGVPALRRFALRRQSVARQFKQENAEELEELEELKAAADGCESEEEARQRIQEDALSVEVCSGWTCPGEDMVPEQFRIVLCTGGPHVQLVGALDEHGDPCRAWLEHCDWFQDRQEYHGPEHDGDALLAYARCFYFGEA